MAIAFAALYRTRHLNQIAEQQKLFSNSGFTRIRVRDDGEGAAI